jgi:hypothetical protein
MIYAQVYNKFLKSSETIYQEIFDAIDWWKFKNMWKRPIEKDDTKALRMIVKHILKKGE